MRKLRRPDWRHRPAKLTIPAMPPMRLRQWKMAKAAGVSIDDLPRIAAGIIDPVMALDVSIIWKRYEAIVHYATSQTQAI